MLEIDNIDRHIIALMQRDARVTNKLIAAETGVSESTVANRLKRLTERKIVRVTIEEDAKYLGYPLYVLANIETELGKRGAVAHAIAERDDVDVVLTSMARSEVMALFFSENDEKCSDTVDGIGMIVGVRKVTLDVATKFYKYSTTYGILHE